MSFKNIKNKYLKKLLRNFDEAAQTYGWESDQGNHESMKEALFEYRLCKKRLVNYLNKKMPEI